MIANNKIKHFGNSILIIPFLIFFIFKNSRKFYFSTSTTIATSSIQKLLIIILTMIIGLLFLNNFYKFVQLRCYANTRIKINAHILPLTVFILLVFLPNLISQFGINFFIKNIYNLFRVSLIFPPFADLQTIIFGIYCNSVNQLGDLITCDNRNSQLVAWNYPTILLKLRSTNHIFSNLNFVVPIICALLLINILYLSKSLNIKQNLVLSLLIFSPPFLLCFNRMNFDLFIVWCLWLGVYFLNSRNNFLNYSAWILFAIASILKFYALIAFIGIYYEKRLKNRLFAIIVFIFSFKLIQIDLSHLRRVVGKDIYGSIGLPVFSSVLNGKNSADIDFFSLGFLTLIFFVVTCILFLNKKRNFLVTPRKGNILIFIFGSVFLFTWFTASNYYYRMLLLFPIIIELLNNQITEFEIKIISSALFSFYLSPKVFGPLQNIFLLPIVIFLGFFLIHQIFSNNERT